MKKCVSSTSSILYALLIQFDLTFCFLRKVGKSWKFCKLHLISEERFGDFCQILAVEGPLEFYGKVNFTVVLKLIHFKNLLNLFQFCLKSPQVEVQQLMHLYS